jgi:hypothetical protein
MTEVMATVGDRGSPLVGAKAGNPQCHANQVGARVRPLSSAEPKPCHVVIVRLGRTKPKILTIQARMTGQQIVSSTQGSGFHSKFVVNGVSHS